MVTRSVAELPVCVSMTVRWKCKVAAAAGAVKPGLAVAAAVSAT